MVQRRLTDRQEDKLIDLWQKHVHLYNIYHPDHKDNLKCAASHHEIRDELVKDGVFDDSLTGKNN